MKYYKFDDPETTKRKCLTVLDYIEVNFRIGNSSSCPVIPKKKMTTDPTNSAEKTDSPQLVNCLQLKSSYLNSDVVKLTTTDLIERRLTAIPHLKKDSDRTSNNILRLAPRLSHLLEKNSVVEEEFEKVQDKSEVVIQEDKEKAGTRGSIQVDSVNLEESPVESPIQLKDNLRLENLISFRHKPTENNSHSKGQERAKSEQIKDVRHKSFNKEVSSPFDKSLHVTDTKEQRISLHRFEIAEDSETSLNPKSSLVPENSSASKLPLNKLMEKDSPTISIGRPPSSNTFSRIRENNQKPQKPSSILIDLRDPSKLYYDRKNELVFPGQKLGVNLPSRLRYENILHRPTDTVVRKFIEIGKRTHVGHTDLGRQSKLLSNPTDTLRQQLYSNSVIRQPLPNERKKPLGFNSGILGGSKHEELLGRRGNLASSIRWPNKHH